MVLSTLGKRVLLFPEMRCALLLLGSGPVLPSHLNQAETLCYSLHHCDRTPDQHHLRSIYLAHSLKAQSITAGKTWWQKCEVAGHTMSIVRKQEEMNNGVQLSPLYAVQGPQPVEWQCPESPWFFPPQLTKCRNSLIDMARSLSLRQF